jgi:cell division protein FtsI/penicillin-binding protein 2
LQKWLFNFGYGHRLPLESLEVINGSLNRSFRQVAGYISSSVPDEPPQSLADAPVLKKTDLRWFGIGQGNFRVTPLQVANAMAVIARKGLYKPPHLIIENDRIDNESVSLNISPFVLSVVYDGMSAVVTEYGGTAYSEFQPMLDYFDAAGVKIYGKTGSTQAPEHAWFGGFAKDNKGRSIAIAIVVEGGQHGSSDAAPLARAIIQLCIESGYLGEPVEYYDEETN